MKELNFEKMEMVSGGSIRDCVGVGLSILGFVALTYTTGPLWAVAGGYGIWAVSTAIAIDGCADTIAGRN
ncbi:hypothetical protein [Mongoliitalea lutea]|nr:hypothetical protein [Mongoliitalea lutea]